MNRIFPYIFIFIILLVFISILNNSQKENFSETERPPGPWGKIGTAKPWYDYPYTLHNIEYY